MQEYYLVVVNDDRDEKALSIIKETLSKEPAIADRFHAEHAGNMLDALADICYIAGEKKYYSGDSREDIATFIHWAKEFQTEHKETNWDETDYMETIFDFIAKKLKG